MRATCSACVVRSMRNGLTMSAQPGAVAMYRFAAFVVVLCACSGGAMAGDAGSDVAAAGTVGGACLSGWECNDGLVCANGVCVAVSMPDASADTGVAVDTSADVTGPYDARPEAAPPVDARDAPAAPVSDSDSDAVSPCGGATTILCGPAPGICVDGRTDNQNCGACGVECAGATACSNGACALVCVGTAPTNCGGQCTNTQTDPMHCGSCGFACASTQTCVRGGCSNG